VSDSLKNLYIYTILFFVIGFLVVSYLKMPTYVASILILPFCIVSGIVASGYYSKTFSARAFGLICLLSGLTFEGLEASDYLVAPLGSIVYTLSITIGIGLFSLSLLLPVTMRLLYTNAFWRLAGVQRVRWLLHLLNHGSFLFARWQAATMLGRFRVYSAVPQLTEALLDTDTRLRAAAAQSLGLIGDTSVTAMLERMIADENEASAREIATQALRKLQTSS